MRKWEILRTNIDTAFTDIYRIFHTNSEEMAVTFCKRFNGNAKWSDSPFHFSYREIK